MGIAKTQREKHNLLVFFALTFLLSWSAWTTAIALPGLATPLLVLGTFGPAMAAIVLLVSSGEGLRHTLSRLLLWRMPLWVYAYALGLPAAGCLVALWLARYITGSGVILPDAMPVYVPVLVFLYVLAFSVAGEELGWRGYALPRLLRSLGSIPASVVLGVIWAVWHLPLFYMASNFHAGIPIALFGLQILASSFIYTHLYLVSNGSLLIAHLFHAAFNTTVGLLPVLPAAQKGDPTAFTLAIGLLTLIAILTAVQLWRQTP